MLKFNIMRWLYKNAPMNFYSNSDDATTIKSINNTFLGYKFNHKFSQEEIDFVWEKIKKYKKTFNYNDFCIFYSFIIRRYFS